MQQSYLLKKITNKNCQRKLSTFPQTFYICYLFIYVKGSMAYVCVSTYAGVCVFYVQPTQWNAIWCCHQVLMTTCRGQNFLKRTLPSTLNHFFVYKYLPSHSNSTPFMRVLRQKSKNSIANATANALYYYSYTHTQNMVERGGVTVGERGPALALNLQNATSQQLPIANNGCKEFFFYNSFLIFICQHLTSAKRMNMTKPTFGGNNYK